MYSLKLPDILAGNMSRILLLVIFMVWIAWYPSLAVPILPGSAGTALFLGGYALLILGLGIWSRVTSRQISHVNFRSSLARFNRTIGAARILIPVWLAVGLYLLHWHDVVEQGMGWLKNINGVFEHVHLPEIIAGTLPAFAAWAGLWWSQYPADRALREQNLLLQLERDVPIHAPPSFWSYFTSNIRLQLLFIFAPIFVLLLARDVAAAGWYFYAHGPLPDVVELGVVGAGFIGVFVFAPALMTRVLKTESLPPSVLRNRLEEMCRRHRLGYRDILLWHTEGNLGNAAVMGVLPGLRYVLLSDVLLETMPDEQIEAVFAHELGHIVYKHLVWYIVFIATLLLILSGPGGSIYDYLLPRVIGNPDVHKHAVDAISSILTAGAIVLFFVLFGFVSRRFERQADVFASRIIHEPSPAGDAPPVSPPGAALFAAALHRVAVVNNIPIAARSWCHGSIEKRMRFLHRLAEHPDRTAEFDRVMRWLYLVLVFALVLSIVGVAWAAG
ncbi:MAG TPA: M48 family metallopeptidase [Tepidisphaeraceae bacterium]|nr:M48 family metallopeptidase [Tepidisphaeraceae bacterium]